jgi:hypothetical protein
LDRGYRPRPPLKLVWGLALTVDLRRGKMRLSALAAALVVLLALPHSADAFSVVRSPNAVTQCLPSAGSLACPPLTTVAEVEPSQWTNLQTLVPPQGPAPAVSPTVKAPAPFTQWVLLSDWRFGGNGGPVPGSSAVVGLRVTVDCLALGAGTEVPLGGVQLRTSGTTMFRRTTPTPAVTIPATRWSCVC